FQVVEHEQTALHLQALQQQIHAPLDAAWQGGPWLRREDPQKVGQEVLAWGGITEGTKDDPLESRGELMHERDRERRSADASHPQHTHHLAALLDYPLLQLQALGLSPIKIVHIEGIAPIEARRGGERRMFGPGRFAVS